MLGPTRGRLYAFCTWSNQRTGQYEYDLATRIKYCISDKNITLYIIEKYTKACRLIDTDPSPTCLHDTRFINDTYICIYTLYKYVCGHVYAIVDLLARFGCSC